jgi:FHA domain
MDSSDIIFELEPQTSLALALCHHDRNREFVSSSAIAFSPDREARESSVSTVHGAEDENDAPSHDTRLRFYFHKLPKDPGTGFVFGRDESCDVFIQSRSYVDKKPFVSRRHFYIVFDGSGRLVIRSFKPARTMSVSYDGHGADENRQGFQWILFDWAEEIIVQPTALIKFRLHLGKNWQQHLAQYLSTTDQHRANPMPTIYGLNLRSQQTTEGPSEALSSTQRPVYLSLSELGRGSFATVYAVIDVSTGVEHAQKIFHDSMPSDRLRTEVDILRSISHVCVPHRLRYGVTNSDVRIILFVSSTS